MSPHPCSGPDRAWLSRCLEVTTESLQELHVMRQEAEDRVRGVLGDQRRSQDMSWSKWPRNVTAEDSLSRGKAAWRNQDCARAKNPELEHIEEEVSGHRHRRNTITKRRKRSSTSHLPDLDTGKGRSQGPNDPQLGRVPSSPIHVLTEDLQHKMALQEDAEKFREIDQRKTSASRYVQERDRGKVRGSREIQMDLGKVRGSRESLERDHGRVRGSRESLERDHGKIRDIQDRDHGKATKSKVIQERGSREIQERGSREIQQRDHGKVTESWQSPMWENEEGSVHRTQEKAMDQDSLSAIEGTEIFQPTEPYLLRRIGSGSLAPRLRLGSSGVTSDLLFTKRFSGNCLSTHSSGFYENSDLDSISSSCSSLCSDSSCYSSFSMISPHRTSVMRPRSIDYTNERRKELQNGRAQPRRPISAGALEGFSFSSISTSRYDITQSNDRTTCDYTYSSTPPHCAIQQRRKAERYICKLALKYRCKPGVSNPLPDLGPPTPRTPASAPLYSECDNSCPPSPQINSLSSSLGDVSKTPKGSWGRFFSRVMLKKDSRIAASELNLQHCIYSPQKNLRSPSLADGQLVRAKSFRDLLSVNPFKKSQKGLNKLW